MFYSLAGEPGGGGGGGSASGGKPVGNEICVRGLDFEQCRIKCTKKQKM
jgi:hypothetical protein